MRVRKLGDTEWIPGTVYIVSSNQESLAIEFEEMIRLGSRDGGFWVGRFLPLRVDTQAKKVLGVLDGSEFELDVWRD